YTFDVAASGQGGVSVSVAASAARDGAGNNSSASNTLSWTYTSADPTWSSAVGTSDPTATAAYTITATFSESVTGFTSGDVSTTKIGRASCRGRVEVYAFDVAASEKGGVSVSVAAAAATDGANGNTASNNLSWTYDGVA